MVKKIPASEVEECQPMSVPKRKSLKIKQPQTTKRNWRKLEAKENERLMEDDVELVTFMRLYWSLIRTFICKGTVQNKFNFYFNRDLQNLIESIAASIVRYRKNRFKINFGFGYLLRDIDAKEFRYYHFSNKNLMLDTAILISTESELISWLKNTAEQDFLQVLLALTTNRELYESQTYIFRKQTPKCTNWHAVSITRFYHI